MKHLYLQEGGNLYKVLTDHKDEIHKLVHAVPHEKFDIIPSNYEMMLAEQTLFMTRNREHKLRALLSDITGYDWVLSATRGGHAKGMVGSEGIVQVPVSPKGWV